jgi:hypothetical protein
MKKPLLLFLLAPFLCHALQAQELTPQVTAASGKVFSSSSGSISWTLGEPVTTPFIAGSAMLTQGFQQPAFLIESLNNEAELFLKLSIYPVPVTGFITLEFQEVNEPLAIELYDMRGTLLYHAPVNSDKVQIDMNSMPPSEYILKINAEQNKASHSYTIIKN